MKHTLLVLLLVLSGTVAPAAEPPVKRLNILFFTADDMNYDSSGVCGGPIKDLTPNLDRLAGEGLRFEFAYSTVAVCQPVRQTMQTGLYPHAPHRRSLHRGLREPRRQSPRCGRDHEAQRGIRSETSTPAKQHRVSIPTRY
jgi:hypothetical protein